MSKEKVVLAYSGGLDTTAIIPWLKENFGYEVICCCIDCGQGEELDGLDERAKLSGASKLYIENIVDDFCDNYIVPCVKAGAVYENKYYAEEGLTPTYAYSYGGNRYYGSSWFAYDNTTSTGGNYILRVSGYSNFALQPLPADGAKGNITAIYTKYSSKSGGYIKYQLLVNSMNDIDF